MSDILELADKIDAVFERVKCFPENQPDGGYLDLILLRNLAHEASAALRSQGASEAVAWRWRHCGGKWTYGEECPKGPSAHLFEVEALAHTNPMPLSSPPENVTDWFDECSKQAGKAFRLHEALTWYADAANCRKGVFGAMTRNGNRNRWEPDNGNTARAALSREEQQA